MVSHVTVIMGVRHRNNTLMVICLNRCWLFFASWTRKQDQVLWHWRAHGLACFSKTIHVPAAESFLLGAPVKTESASKLNRQRSHLVSLEFRHEFLLVSDDKAPVPRDVGLRRGLYMWCLKLWYVYCSL